jgi:hypothetical protein
MTVMFLAVWAIIGQFSLCRHERSSSDPHSHH